MLDIGFGAVIVALEKYCGVLATKWLLRLIALFIAVMIVHHTLLWAFDLPLHEVIAAIGVIEVPDRISDAISETLFRLGLIVFALMIAFSLFLLSDIVLIKAARISAMEMLIVAERKCAEAEAKLIAANKRAAQIDNKKQTYPHTLVTR